MEGLPLLTGSGRSRHQLQNECQHPPGGLRRWHQSKHNQPVGGAVAHPGDLQQTLFDYTQLSISGGITLKQGDSPFDFDQAIDLGTIGIGLTQQIAGPLVLNAGIGLNVDPASEYYGDVIESNIELLWQRRSYDVGFYVNPYEGIGGFRFRLHDFDFSGTCLLYTSDAADE